MFFSFLLFKARTSDLDVGNNKSYLFAYDGCCPLIENNPSTFYFYSVYLTKILMKILWFWNLSLSLSLSKEYSLFKKSFLLTSWCVSSSHWNWTFFVGFLWYTQSAALLFIIVNRLHERERKKWRVIYVCRIIDHLGNNTITSSQRERERGKRKKHHRYYL